MRQLLIVYDLLISFVIQSCDPLDGKSDNKLQEPQPKVEVTTEFLEINNSYPYKNVEVEDKDEEEPSNRKDEEESTKRKLEAKKKHRLGQLVTSNLEDKDEERPSNRKVDERSTERKIKSRKFARRKTLSISIDSTKN